MDNNRNGLEARVALCYHQTGALPRFKIQPYTISKGKNYFVKFSNYNKYLPYLPK